MNRFIEKHGPIKSTILFTLISAMLSVMMAMLIYVIFLSIGINLNLKYTLSLSAFIPLIVGPLIIVPFIRMIIKIDGLEKEMRQLATYDSLTGLLTRRAFMEQAEVVEKQLERFPRHVCVIAIDFDDFKSINDMHGHACGDMILEVFGEVAKVNSRKGDVLGRLGGEEFAFLLTDMTVDGAIQYLDRLKSRIAACHLTFEGHDIPFTISSGISELKPEVTIETALRNADKALYEAKHTGKDLIIVYDN